MAFLIPQNEFCVDLMHGPLFFVDCSAAGPYNRAMKREDRISKNKGVAAIRVAGIIAMLMLAGPLRAADKAYAADAFSLAG